MGLRAIILTTITMLICSIGLAEEQSLLVVKSFKSCAMSSDESKCIIRSYPVKDKFEAVRMLSNAVIDCNENSCIHYVCWVELRVINLLDNVVKSERLEYDWMSRVCNQAKGVDYEGKKYDLCDRCS